MTFEPLLLSLTDPADVIRVGAQKINTNFSLIASSIEEAIQGIAYQNPVESISNVAPVEGIPLGSRYIIDFGILESDPWYGHIDEIAELSNDSPYEWIFLVPDVGWCLTVKDEDVEYLYNGEQWNSRPSVTQHNALSGIDGSTYHVSSDVYGALAGTGTPSAENKFVTADSLITDITTHTHDGEVTAQVDYGDLDNVPLTFAPTSHTHSKTDVTDFAHTHAEADITDLGDYAALVNSMIPTSNLGTGTADSTTYLRGDQTWAILASGNNFVTVTAGETLAKYDIVYINTSDSNKAYKAVNNGTMMQSEVLGMVTETGGIALNGTGQVIVNGTQTYGSWTWTPNKWLYLDSTSGTLTQTLSTTNGQYAVPVAIALSATQIYIQPMTGWVVNNNDNITLGCKKVTFDESTGTVAILTPPANAVITQITVVVTSDAAASGGSIKIGTAADDDIVMATTVVDLEEAGNHVYDPFYSVGATPVQYNLSVTAGAQEFDGVVYFHYAVPNVVTGTGGCFEVDFTQATSSPALLGVLPDNVVVTRCTVVVDTAASGGSPTVSIGTVGDIDLLFDETDCSLETQGIYLYDPFVETSGSVYLTVTPDSQSFSGRIYLQYMAVS